MNPEVRRLFLALWPDEAARRALGGVQQRLPVGLGRPVGGENLHITLLFLGDTTAERQDCLEDALSGIVRPGFDLQLDRLGYWRKPQVLWAGSAFTPPPLAALVQDLREAAAGCGCTVDARPFQIHLTLCRKVRKAPRDLPAMAVIPWPVKAFVLAESVAAASGARYRILRDWPLAPAAGGSTSG